MEINEQQKQVIIKKYNVSGEVADYLMEIEVIGNGVEYQKRREGLRKMCKTHVEREGAYNALEEIWRIK